ncbi:unnamed protein product [Rangifer tarandus platyrhynchus]|uniref:Uncharacterized protein n=1 Tax=Rangifer tarandus platyrhynchus TaxID=3082113 RepID=A0AC59ZVY5_RANTA
MEPTQAGSCDQGVTGGIRGFGCRPRTGLQPGPTGRLSSPLGFWERGHLTMLLFGALMSQPQAISTQGQVSRRAFQSCVPVRHKSGSCLGKLLCVHQSGMDRLWHAPKTEYYPPPRKRRQPP